jgi:predicted Zn-ribbon and HTH transcriptional regulator
MKNIKWKKWKFKLQPNDCVSCGGGGNNDPTGVNGDCPYCLICKGTGKRNVRKI